MNIHRFRAAHEPNGLDRRRMVFSRKFDRFLILWCGLNANGAKWQISRKQQEIRAIRLICSIRAERILVLEKTMIAGGVSLAAKTNRVYSLMLAKSKSIRIV
jgi:hypothetical protein